jgi:TRAP-type C4-dicarboxylate transport system permease small subunit
MRKETALLWLSLLVFAAPLLGIPETWRASLLFVLGFGLFLIAILFRIDARKAARTPHARTHEEHDPALHTLTTSQ